MSTSGSGGKIAVENVNMPGHVKRVDAARYTNRKAALLRALPHAGPGLTRTEIKAAALPHLSPDPFPGGAAAGWRAKTGQLDMVAKGQMVREATKLPALASFTRRCHIAMPAPAGALEPNSKACRAVAEPIPYRKMNGLGNRFAVLDARTDPVREGLARLSEPRIARLAKDDRIGFDQFIVIEPPRHARADAFMRIRNADGGEVEACGNAMRCIGWLLTSEMGRDAARIETVVGVMEAVRDGDHRVGVNMGRPRLKWDEIPLSEEFRDTRMIELEIGPRGAPILHSPAVVNVGNPHVVFFVDRLEDYDLARLGPMIEHHPLFPERVNVSLVQVLNRGEVRLIVWERGVGLTEACGTAACAAVVAGARKRLTYRHITVHLPGGPLDVEWREGTDEIIMTGALEDEGDGLITDAMLEGVA